MTCEPHHRWSVLSSVLLAILIGCSDHSVPVPLGQLLQQAQHAIDSGNHNLARKLAQQLLQSYPTQPDAALLAARCAEFAGQLDAAESHYRAALQLDPNHVPSCEGLAKLLATCGRQHEAEPFVLRLIRNRYETDLLLLIAREGTALQHHDQWQHASLASPVDVNTRLGMAGHWANTGREREAIDLLEQLPAACLPAQAALGKLLAAQQQWTELQAWEQQLPATAKNSSEAWYARGQLAAQQHRWSSAIHHISQAVRLAPHHERPLASLVNLLATHGNLIADDQTIHDVLVRLRQHQAQLERLEQQQLHVMHHGPGEGARDVIELASCFEACGRLWEALAWRRVAVSLDPTAAQRHPQWAEFERKVIELPIELTAPSAHPLPQGLPQATRTITPSVVATSHLPDLPPDHEFRFRNDASTCGFQFEFFNGVDGTTQHRMFEFTGGGIGVIDFDRDDWPDFFLTQGCRWPPPAPSTALSDQLLRNLNGQHFVSASRSAAIQEPAFGQGIAIGDIDSDGFPDAYVANIGQNVLWHNLGDGTFRPMHLPAHASSDWTTSVAMADLNADGHPDLYDVNYVHSSDVFQRVCRTADDSPRICLPVDFDAAPDRICLSDGAGSFYDATAKIFETAPLGKGLGVVVWGQTGRPGLSLLIANDTTPNFLFQHLPERNPARLSDNAFAAGVAINRLGKATGCMGIALADLNHDGQPDLHITNFHAESNTLFTSLPDGSWQDVADRWQLEPATRDLLGFGTQFLDVNQDGAWELFIANGHIANFTSQNRPYRMPLQVFSQHGAAFRPLAATALGESFQQLWLGRAAAVCDWNGDGAPDIALGQMQGPYALLTNIGCPPNRGFALRLSSRSSERDAIGAMIEVVSGNETRYYFVTAGDGYQSSNERWVRCGLAAGIQANRVTIHWPSGERQSFTQVAAGNHYLAVEGRPLVVHHHNRPQP